MARAIDLIKFCKEIMKRLSKNDIRMEDYRHVEMLDDYDVEPGTEDAAWLQGYLMRKIVACLD